MFYTGNYSYIRIVPAQKMDLNYVFYEFLFCLLFLTGV